MRKLITLALIATGFAMAVSFPSCKEDKKETPQPAAADNRDAALGTFKGTAVIEIDGEEQNQDNEVWVVTKGGSGNLVITDDEGVPVSTAAVTVDAATISAVIPSQNVTDPDGNTRTVQGAGAQPHLTYTKANSQLRFSFSAVVDGFNVKYTFTGARM